MQVEGIGARITCPNKLQIATSRNCSPIKAQNGCDSFVSGKGKSVSFGQTDGMVAGGILGWIGGIVAVTVLAPVAAPALAIAAAQTAAGAAGLVGGAVVGDKI